MTAERERIQLLVERDGKAAARAWVERTLRAYRTALDEPHSHAHLPQYRPLFEASVREFEMWLKEERRGEDPMEDRQTHSDRLGSGPRDATASPHRRLRRD